MSKHTLITLLGFFVALVPFLGFPASWKTFLIVASGLVIAFLALTIIARKRKKNYKKNNPVHNHDHHVVHDIHARAGEQQR
jgi:ABC-type nickel/cobalt efflux system permease component RcnA